MRVLFYMGFFFGILMLVLFQIHFLDVFESLRFRMNFVLLLTLYSTLALSLSTGLKVSFLAGILLDVFSALPFGVYTMALCASNVFTFFLFRRFFVNRSVHSLSILVTSGTIFFLSIFFTTAWFLHIIGWHQFSFTLGEIFPRFVWQIPLHTLFAILIFLILRTFRKQFFFSAHF